MSSQLLRIQPQIDAQVSAYAQKWRKLALSTQPLHRPQAIASVREFYRSLHKREPRVRIFDSPHQMRKELLGRSPAILAQELGAPILLPATLDLYNRVTARLDANLVQELHDRLQTTPLAQQVAQSLWAIWQHQDRLLSSGDRHNLHRLQTHLRDRLFWQVWQDRDREWRSQLRQLPGGDWMLQLGDSVRDTLWDTVGEPLWQQAIAPLYSQLEAQLQTLPPIREWQATVGDLLGHAIDGLGLGVMAIRPSLDLSYIPVIDFAISALHCQPSTPQWLATHNFISDCGWAFPFENTCILIDRPTHWTFDDRDRLHGEGQPAIRFRDGYGVYAYAGVVLPERYAAVGPSRWKAQWLLEEPNAELRRVLIQGIGYGRLCQELQARELDRWREYSLLRIESNVDVEPIYLLKMTCPSTGYVHATRVPPTMRSARDAIRWTNWGVDPSEFSVET